MTFRRRIRNRRGVLSSYVACPKQKHDGSPRTNHFYDCEKCFYLVKVFDDGIECNYNKTVN